MRYRLATEDIEPNHWVIWMLDLPGCFSSAQTEAEAVAHAPERIQGYWTWLSEHDPTLPRPEMTPPAEIEVVESFRSFASEEDPDYLVNAFFDDDRRPVTYWEAEVALRLLKWTRDDLLKVIRPLGSEQLNQSLPDELRGSIGGVVKHIAGAENWYLDQLGLGLGQSQLPKDPLEMLHTVRTNTHAQLLKLIGDERVTQDRDELWSGRKVIRRTLWHERDHVGHIAQLLLQL